MNKIKSLKIKGLRGIKEQLHLDLQEKSILIYGENGAGKSSITDAVEWFYHNRIDHLSGEEIGQGGVKALRNVFLKKEEKGQIDLEFSEHHLNSRKSLFFRRDSLHYEHYNQSQKYKDYLKESQKENLLLRQRDLAEFILASKKEKLDYLSKIIGFSEVTKIRDIFKKIVNELKKEIKIKNFNTRVSQLESRLIELLNQRTVTENQLMTALNLLIAPLKLNRQLTGIEQVDEVLDLIKTPADTRLVELESFYTRILDWTGNLNAILTEIENLYENYCCLWQKMTADLEKFNKVLLERLLAEGFRLLREDVVKADECPLCLQPKDKDTLMAELEKRLGDLENIKKEKSELLETRDSLKKTLDHGLQRLKMFLSDPLIRREDNRQIEELLEKIKGGFETYLLQLDIELSAANKPEEKNRLSIDRGLLKQIAALCAAKIKKLKESKKDDHKYEIYSKIIQSRDTFCEIKKLKKEKKIVENQAASCDILYSEFLKKQQEGIESFLNLFSKDINDLYSFMNPGEKVAGITLVPIEKNDELVGITLEYKFFKEYESPPQKYLSESHLNCLGIAFFLTSVKAFNKNNNFFILDDVVSSFDAAHKRRFAELLIEKFPSCQVILLTHEKNWFAEAGNLFRENNWHVAALKWDNEKGTYLSPENSGQL